jgi:hypothetical protein
MYADKGWTVAPGRMLDATARGRTRCAGDWGMGVEEVEVEGVESSIKSTREEGNMEVVGGRGGN